MFTGAQFAPKNRGTYNNHPSKQKFKTSDKSIIFSTFLIKVGLSLVHSNSKVELCLADVSYLGNKDTCANLVWVNHVHGSGSVNNEVNLYREKIKSQNLIIPTKIIATLGITAIHISQLKQPQKHNSKLLFL